MSSAFVRHIVIGKIIGFLFGAIAFFVIPLIFSEAHIMLRLAVWLWYTTLGAIVGIIGGVQFLGVGLCSLPNIFRGGVIGAWMNFVLVLFIYPLLSQLMMGSIFEGYSPFWIVVEGAILGIIVDIVSEKLPKKTKEKVKKSAKKEKAAKSEDKEKKEKKTKKTTKKVKK